MCLALYLAASQELPVIAWDKANPAFHVIRLPKNAEGVRKHFHSEYVYYAGSAQGCSCAFNYEHESDSIESPGMIGMSVNVVPPSAVERNVASL